MRRAHVLGVVGLGFGLVATFGPLPAASAAPALVINPTSGPIGTPITATVTGCTGGSTTGTAKLEFMFTGLTASASTTFAPAATGSTTVAILATEKAGQSEALVAAAVVLSGCLDGSPITIPFTVTRGATTSSSSTSSSSTSSTSSSTSTSTTATTAPSTTSTTAASNLGVGGVSDASVTPGQVVTIGGDGFAANAPLTVTLQSTPIAIGNLNATAAGGYSAAITIPLAAPPGNHSIVVAGPGANGAPREVRAAVAVEDLDCEQLTRTQAQRVLDADRTDPHRLDADRDGIACEGSSDGGLARTGTSTVPLVVSGILLIGFGSLTLAQRKRYANQRTR